MNNYFILQQDRRLMDTIVLNDLTDIKNYRNVTEDDGKQIPDMSVAFVKSSVKNIYPGMIDRQITMINNELVDVFNLFIRNARYKYCCLMDHENDKYVYYSIPLMEVMNLDLFTQKREKPTGHIFKVIENDRVFFIVSLLCAEAILRRDITGIQIIKL